MCRQAMPNERYKRRGDFWWRESQKHEVGHVVYVTCFGQLFGCEILRGTRGSS